MEDSRSVLLSGPAPLSKAYGLPTLGPWRHLTEVCVTLTAFEVVRSLYADSDRKPPLDAGGGFPLCGVG